MRVYKEMALIGLVVMSAAAVAADTLQIRPGRWEATMEMVFPGGKPPAGMPFAEPMTSIDCITPEDLAKLKAPIALPEEEGCKVTNYKASGTQVAYAVQCTEMSMDVQMTVHSPDSFSGISRSHGKDPTQQMTMKFSGKRIGDVCSAKELAERDAE